MYARDAARFSTGGKLPELRFAQNHAGQPDVAVFDFTCMYRAENASLVRERRGRKLLTALVGDCLVEVGASPFTWKPPDCGAVSPLAVFPAALLAPGDRDRPGVPGCLRHGVDGEELGSGGPTPEGAG